MERLKKRPFFVVNLVKKPAEGAYTNLKEFGDSDNWVILESISIEDSVKQKHLTEAAVIIDLFKATVIKNRLEKSNEEVMKYFIQKYNKEVVEGISIWMEKNNKNLSVEQLEKIEKNIDKPEIIEEVISE